MATRQHPEGPVRFDGDFATPQPLLLPASPCSEQSLLLADGKILMVTVDRPAAELVLTRHLRSGHVDSSFGEHGLQRIGTEIAASIGTLALEAEANGNLVIHGSLVDESSDNQALWQLQLMPCDDARPRLGVQAFLSVSRWPLAGAMAAPEHARHQWT